MKKYTKPMLFLHDCSCNVIVMSGTEIGTEWNNSWNLTNNGGNDL